MNPLTVFSWGYWGWGTSTERLLEAVDAVERKCGYKPPVFVDIRYRRSGRAPGFVGDAFQRTVGPNRYVWLQDLGNEAIQQGGEIRIKNPIASNELLQLAIDGAQSNRRIVYFCACELPGTLDQPYCHRTVVAGLLLETAKYRNVPLRVIEWPGGDVSATELQVELPPQEYKALIQGKKSIPIHEPFSLDEMACVPHFAIVEVWPAGNRQESSRFITGPARYKDGGWYLPALGEVDHGDSVSTLLPEIQRLRDVNGYTSRDVC